MLDIVNAGKPDVQQVEEIILICWEGLIGEDLEEVAEIVSPSNQSCPVTIPPLSSSETILLEMADVRVERDPSDVIKQHQSRRDQQLSKVIDVNPVFLVPLEINSRVLQQVD